jgi:hypothetical protein
MRLMWTPVGNGSCRFAKSIRPKLDLSRDSAGLSHAGVAAKRFSERYIASVVRFGSRNAFQ